MSGVSFCASSAQFDVFSTRKPEHIDADFAALFLQRGSISTETFETYWNELYRDMDEMTGDEVISLFAARPCMAFLALGGSLDSEKFVDFGHFVKGKLEKQDPWVVYQVLAQLLHLGGRSIHKLMRDTLVSQAEKLKPCSTIFASLSQAPLIVIKPVILYLETWFGPHRNKYSLLNQDKMPDLLHEVLKARMIQLHKDIKKKNSTTLFQVTLGIAEEKPSHKRFLLPLVKDLVQNKIFVETIPQLYDPKTIESLGLDPRFMQQLMNLDDSGWLALVKSMEAEEEKKE